jgi:endonuclease YncB( thermonuclease family)
VAKQKIKLYNSKSLLLVLISIVFILHSNSGWSASLTGQVFAVKSGELITVSESSNQFREIQLIGIDSPPVNTPTGRLSRRHLHMLLAGKFVTIVYQSINQKGMILGRVFRGGADMNLRMIEAGQAQVSMDAKMEQKVHKSYLSAQKTSQSRGLGIWQKPPN